ncbi:type IV pilus assembly protein PilC [Ekhidna lutea]|uniref:General secretion pathway protein F n=1 Tax=Ekhidna lutea TaxID=447679 RepID=A0A239K895_EKHLU|nr:type II secretion system F family protein [Ekhidna lutea]SNT13978.1 type IV pilus assembly protein PilC [Ekhidna lutea]
MSGLDLNRINKQVSPKSKTQSKNILDLLNKEISLSKPITDKIKEAFYSELNSMLVAGIDLKSCIDLIADETKKEKQKDVFKLISQEMIKGNTLAQALRKTNSFGPYEYFSIKIGEETGQLPKVTHDLSIYFKRKLDQKRQLVTALSYPLLILITSLGAVSFMMFFMVPMFSDVFTRFGGELPAVTQLVIDFSAFLSSHWLILLFIIVLLTAILIAIRKNEKFVLIKDRLIIKLPFFGKLYSSLYMAQFCNSMALLISSKVSLTNAIELMESMINFSLLKEVMPVVKDDLMNGESLHNSLSKNSLFDKKMITMIKIGEEVTQLDSFFQKLGDQYSEEVKYRTTQLNTFMEPMLIIFLGVVVGFILITMYLPMFQISTNLGL